MTIKTFTALFAVVFLGISLSAVAVLAAGNAPLSPQDAPEPADSLLEGTLDEDLHGILSAGALNLIPGVAGNGLDPNAATLWTQDVLTDGAQTGDRFSDVLVSGDFNGDGYFDVAIGIPEEDWESWDGLETRLSSGAVNVIYNTPHGLDAATHQFWDQNETGVSVVEDSDRFGFALAAGDFNGDGYEDLAISAPYESLERESQVITATGAVVVLYGTPQGLSANQARLLTESDCNLFETAHDFFGYALAAGNFDNDRYDDLAIGIPGATVSAASDAGIICTLHGAAEGFSTPSNPWWQQGSAEAGDFFGSVLTTGDFNGDGYDDLVIGDPDEDVFDKTDAGAIFIMYGGEDGLEYTTAQEWWQDIIVDESGNPEDPSEAYDRFGEALAAGDFNRDGKDDLLIGTPHEEIAFFGSDCGVVQLMFGSAGGVTTSGNDLWEDTIGGELFGFALAAGDFNHDGWDDFAVGAPGYPAQGYQNAGAVHVFYNSGNTADLFPDAATQVIVDNDLPSNTSEAGDRFGNSLAVLPRPLERVYLPLVRR